MIAQFPKLSTVFYRTGGGNEPVREWIKSLLKAQKKAIGNDISTVQFGWPVGMPACRPLGAGLFEVRTALGNTIARVIFCVKDDQMYLLHGFIKKTRKTGDDDLKLARKRKREIESELRKKKPKARRQK